MPELDQEKMELLVRRLEIGFYALLFLALVVGLTGAPGLGFLLLVLGGCAHVGRASLEEVLRGRGPGVEEIRISRQTAKRPASRPSARSSSR
jgi:hypothetical protein